MAHRRRGRPVSAGGNGVGVGLELGVRVKVGMHATCTWTCDMHIHMHVYYARRFQWRCPRVECRRLLPLVGAVTVEALAANAHLDDEHPLHAVSE